MKNFILKSVIFSFILSLFLIGTYLAIQARNSSSTGLPMDSSNPSALYVDEEEILTAAKRNALVDNSGGVKMKVFKGTTANADETTFNHGLDWNKILGVNCYVLYNGNSYFPMSDYFYNVDGYNRMTYI